MCIRPPNGYMPTRIFPQTINIGKPSISIYAFQTIDFFSKICLYGFFNSTDKNALSLVESTKELDQETIKNYANDISGSQIPRKEKKITTMTPEGNINTLEESEPIIQQEEEKGGLSL